MVMKYFTVACQLLSLLSTSRCFGFVPMRQCGILPTPVTASDLGRRDTLQQEEQPDQDSVRKRYVEQVSRHYGKHTIANWNPSSPLCLGDYGSYENGIFQVHGNIKQLDLEYCPRISESRPFSLRYISSGVEFTEIHQGSLSNESVQEGEAGIDVHFKNDFGVILTADSCVTYRFDNVESLGTELLRVGSDFACVTGVTDASRTTTVISSISGSHIKFKVGNTKSVGSDQMVDLGGLEVLQRDTGVITLQDRSLEGRSVPLFSIHQIRRLKLSRAVFAPITNAANIASVKAKQWGWPASDRLPVFEAKTEFGEKKYTKVPATSSAFGSHMSIATESRPPLDPSVIGFGSDTFDAGTDPIAHGRGPLGLPLGDILTQALQGFVGMPRQNRQYQIPMMRTILILAANPFKTQPLSIGNEVKAIEDVLERSRLRDSFCVVQRWAVTDEDLIHSLVTKRPEIVHFSGHGAGPDGLVFEDSQGGQLKISGQSLRQLFECRKKNVKCVVLNACFSEDQAKPISDHIYHVVGMKDAILDISSIKFSKGFYTALGDEGNFTQAFNLGRAAVGLTDIDQSMNPVLYVGGEKISPGEND